MFARSGSARRRGALALVAAALLFHRAHAQVNYNRADMMRIAPSRLDGVRRSRHSSWSRTKPRSLSDSA